MNFAETKRALVALRTSIRADIASMSERRAIALRDALNERYPVPEKPAARFYFRWRIPTRAEWPTVHLMTGDTLTVSADLHQREHSKTLPIVMGFMADSADVFERGDWIEVEGTMSAVGRKIEEPNDAYGIPSPGGTVHLAR